MIPTAPASSSDRFATLVSVLLIIIVVTVLFVMKEIFVTLALAMLFSFLLNPLVRRFERWRLPRIPAVLLAVGIALAILAGVGYLVGAQLLDLTQQLPKYKDNISQRIKTLKHTDPNSQLSKATQTIQDLGQQISGAATDANGKPDGSPTVPSIAAPANATRPDSYLSAGKEKISKVEVVQPATTIGEVIQSMVGPVVGPLGTAAVVLVFVLFMLIKHEDLRDRIIHLIGRGRLNVTTQALDEAGSKVTGYLTMQCIINAIFGVLVGTGLYLIGVPNAFLWGLLAILLRFIPYVGAWISLAFPLALSLAVTSTWRMPIETLALFATIELVTSNVLEPWLYGAHTGLSPVAIMLATIFWTWLWGGVGLLLATPLTVVRRRARQVHPQHELPRSHPGRRTDADFQRPLLPAAPRPGPPRGQHRRRGIPGRPHAGGGVFLAVRAGSGGGGARGAGRRARHPAAAIHLRRHARNGR